jgi:hypothetical protein
MFGVKQCDHEDTYKYELLFALSSVAVTRPSLSASEAEPPRAIASVME